LVATLAAGGSTAFAQLTAADIAALREQGRKEGWTFQVGESAATKRPISQLCGAVEPPDWQAERPLEAVQPEFTASSSSFDWRTQAGYPPIRDQGTCESCWAFATVAPLEWNINIKDGVAVDLSEQWLICCNLENPQWNCTGGWAAHSYHQNKLGACGHSGAVLEAYYPYGATNCSNCACTSATNHVYHIASWAYLGASNTMPTVAAIKQAILDHGPVTVCVVGSSGPFQAYKGGIFNYNSSANTDHMVALVGWDDNQAGGVWFLRNSWGTDWGENGYMRIKYGYSKVGYGASYINYPGADPMQVSPGYGFDSQGLLGGPFTPATMLYTLTNQGANNVYWDILSTPSWLSLGINWGGTLTPGGSMTVTATVSSVACSLGPGCYTGFIYFINDGDLQTNSLPVSLTVGRQTIYTEPLDTKPKWTTTAGGEWQFGQPTGGGAGIFGFPDPTSGYTGTNVWGVNLNGDYSLTNVPSPWYYLTTSAYDFRGYTRMALQFERWLNCRPATPFAANVSIDVSTNLSAWTTIWSNLGNGAGIYDAYWTNVQYTFPAWVDNYRYVYVRWGYKVPDDVWCSGWNIDDILFLGIHVPIITNQPAGCVSDAGTTATFSVTAGGLGPLSYQWVKYGTNYLTDGGKISGATNSTLSISNVLKADQGNYSVVITNIVDGAVTSSSATLTVNDPLITSQPASRTNIAGTTATFTVSASGTTPLGYQWVKNGTNYLADANNVSGAMTTTLTLTNVAQSDAASYTAIVTNPAGSLASSPAILTVLVPPVITTQPQSQTNHFGTTAAFTVSASGTEPLSYQWRKGGTDLADCTDVSLTLTNVGRRDNGVYAVLVTNICNSALSSNATLVVRVPQRLGTPSLLSDGTCIILSGDADGGLLSTNDLANFDLYASTNLETWVLLANSLSLTNGQLLLCDPGSTNLPLRFYRVIER